MHRHQDHCNKMVKTCLKSVFLRHTEWIQFLVLFCIWNHSGSTGWLPCSLLLYIAIRGLSLLQKVKFSSTSRGVHCIELCLRAWGIVIHVFMACALLSCSLSLLLFTKFYGISLPVSETIVFSLFWSSQKSPS